MDEVLVGALLPAGAPDEFEMGLQGAQVLARGGRKVMRNAVDGQEGPIWTSVQIPPEQGDDAVDIQQKQRNMAICGAFQVTSVTQRGCLGVARVSILRVGFKHVGGDADRGTDRRRHRPATRNLLTA